MQWFAGFLMIHLPRTSQTWGSQQVRKSLSEPLRLNGQSSGLSRSFRVQNSESNMTRVAAGTNSFHDTVSIDSEETLDESAIGGPVSLSACVLNIETDSGFH